MITDKQLMKVCIVIAIVGFAFLFVVLQFITPESIKIKDINEKMIGRIATINGTVNSFSEKDGNIFIKLGDDTGNITVVMFQSDAKNFNFGNLKKSGRVSVTGKVSLYKSELEVVAISIKVL